MKAAPRLRAWLVRRPHSDIALASGVWAVVLLTTLLGPRGERPNLVDGLLAALACAALVLRHRWPFVALAVSVAAAEGFLAHSGGQRAAVILAAPLIAVYTVAESAQRLRALVVSGMAVLALGLVHLVVRPGVIPGAENVALAALGGVAMAAGQAARNHRAFLAEVQARAAQAEADREAEAARRVTGERLRIARDLHDALGHQLALINIQSALAARLLPTEPDRAAEALDHVHAASRAALAELSETVGVLRQPGEPDPPLEPQAGLAGLDRLGEAFRRSGLSIVVIAGGAARPLPPSVELATYRIVQEALTNVVKHANGTEVTVTIDYRPAELSLRVDNTAARRPAASPAGYGSGLVGMRERAAAVGGALWAGPRPDGGFRVTAVLPTGSLP